MTIAEGTLYGEWLANRQNPRAARQLSFFGLKEGDLVQLAGQGINGGGIIFRIAKDCPPKADARWGSYVCYVKARWGYKLGKNSAKSSVKKNDTVSRVGWLDTKRHLIPELRLNGCIELVPVFSFMSFKEKKHVISYTQVPERVKKVDLIALATSFASFQLFMNQELKRLSGE